MPEQAGNKDAEAAGAARCCRRCGRPEGVMLRVIPDGRWFDAERQVWRDGEGGEAEWPDIVDYSQVREAEAGIAVIRIERGAENPHWAEEVPLCGDCRTVRRTGRRTGA